MLLTLIKVIKNVKIIHEPMPLGRWNHNCEKSKIIKAIHASHDSCGDSLCGTPLFVKNITDKELIKKDYITSSTKP